MKEGISSIIRREFIDYRKCDTIWGYICNDKVNVRVPNFESPQDDDSVWDVLSPKDSIPVVTLEVSEKMEKRKRYEVTSRDRYFNNNNMYAFISEFKKEASC